MREFVCKYCGHKVVVRPNLPPDYEPNVCTPCYEAQGFKAKDEEFMRKLYHDLNELFKLMGLEPLS